MGELWYPPASKADLATSNAGPFLGGAAKGGLHTTESWVPSRLKYLYSPALGVYKGQGFWPHFTATIENGPFQIYQHLPINVAGKAFEHPAGTGITNADNIIQIEMCWGANHAAEMPQHYIDGIAAWMRWVEQNHGVARQAQPFPGHRMDWASFNAYSGWVGHCHVPANSHMDPGPVPIAKLLGDSPPQTGDDMTPDQARLLAECHAALDMLMAAFIDTKVPVPGEPAQNAEWLIKNQLSKVPSIVHKLGA